MNEGNPRLASIMGRLLRWVAAVSMFLAGLSLTVLVLLFLAVILLRFFGVSVPSADDIAGILLGGTLALGFAAAVPMDHHISVDYFVDRMGERTAAFLRVAAFIVSILVVGYLLAGFARMWYAAWLSGITMLGHLPIPRAGPMGVVLAGIVMFELALVLRFLERLFGIGFGPKQSEDVLSGAV
jgi:TRAP-type C4-dicarboxylate transport system permease small subunit